MAEHITTKTDTYGTPMTPAGSIDGWGEASNEETYIKPEVDSPKRSFSAMASDTASGSTLTRRPMRKRAKTQEEKEQRAQERVMRNRAAAQISRERKRDYVATLEIENQQLNERVESLAAQNFSLENSVSLLTQRLEAMEKMLSFLSAPGSTPGESLFSEQDAIDIEPFALPTPPGTIRPHDLQSIASTPCLELIDSRNPAVIAAGPQRRSMRLPRHLSSHSPIYRQMTSILVFWTTILRVTTSPHFATLASISLQWHISQRVSRCKSSNQRRFAATDLKSPATALESNDALAGIMNPCEQNLASEEQRRLFDKFIGARKF